MSTIHNHVAVYGVIWFEAAYAGCMCVYSCNPPPKLQALVYDILPLVEGAGKRWSECARRLHVWQKDPGLLRATAVRRGRSGYQIRANTNGKTDIQMTQKTWMKKKKWTRRTQTVDKMKAMSVFFLIFFFFVFCLSVFCVSTSHLNFFREEGIYVEMSKCFVFV